MTSVRSAEASTAGIIELPLITGNAGRRDQLGGRLFAMTLWYHQCDSEHLAQGPALCVAGSKERDLLAVDRLRRTLDNQKETPHGLLDEPKTYSGSSYIKAGEMSSSKGGQKQLVHSFRRLRLDLRNEGEISGCWND